MGRKAGKSKKRNKKYSGIDAKRPTNLVRVHKVDAVVRSDFSQWLYDHKTTIRYGAIGVVIVVLVIAGFVTLF